jgi:hypothetical protein
MGFWIIGFTDHLQVVITSNYNTVVISHFINHAKLFQPAVSTLDVSW